jgi:ubiquinone/menaquinone biosynthesis C-methylase UbiE
VTGVDFAPAMLEKARTRPEPVRWELADAQSLPYADGSFDVVVSGFGVVFAPDAERAAGELARVCRGRIGITAWRPHPEQEVWARVLGERPPAEPWSSEEGIRTLLAPFDLRLEEDVWYLEGETAEAIWEWQSRAVPPHKERLRRLDAEQAASARTAVAELHEQFRESGSIRYPRPFLLAHGARR